MSLHVLQVLHDKAFNITKNPKYDGYPRGLALMVHKFFNKKISGGVVKSEIMPNQELAEELHKPIIKKFENMQSILKIIFLVLI